MTREAWMDERLEAAYRARFARPAPPSVMADTIDAVRAGRRPRVPARRTPRVGLLGLAAVVAVVLVGASAFALRFGLYPGGGVVTDGPPGYRTFSGSGISFDFPAGWEFRDATAMFSGGSAIGVVGTLPVDPLCGLGHIDINCYHEQRLEPGTISVVIGTGAYRGGTIFDAERAVPPTVRTIVAGMPALFTDRGHVEGNYYLADLELTWEIANPSTPTNVYRIDVGIRGPGVDDYRRQAEQLVASLRFTTPPASVPSDPASAAAAGRAALAEAESADRQMWALGDGTASWYACFGEAPATSSDGIVATSPGGHLDPPVFAVCRWTIRTEGAAFWRLDLQTDWSRDGRSGRVHETRWLSADGRAVASAFDGDFPPTTDTETPRPPPAGSPAVTIELDDAADGRTVAEIFDETGLLIDARSARSDELDPTIIDPADGNAIGGPNPSDRPNELIIQWYGGACDPGHILLVEDRGRSIAVFDRPATGPCTDQAVLRGVVITFSEPIPAGEVTITRIPASGAG